MTYDHKSLTSLRLILIIFLYSAFNSMSLMINYKSLTSTVFAHFFMFFNFQSLVPPFNCLKESFQFRTLVFISDLWFFMLSTHHYHTIFYETYLTQLQFLISLEWNSKCFTLHVFIQYTFYIDKVYVYKRITFCLLMFKLVKSHIKFFYTIKILKIFIIEKSLRDLDSQYHFLRVRSI